VDCGLPTQSTPYPPVLSSLVRSHLSPAAAAFLFAGTPLVLIPFPFNSGGSRRTKPPPPPREPVLSIRNFTPEDVCKVCSTPLPTSVLSASPLPLPLLYTTHRRRPRIPAITTRISCFSRLDFTLLHSSDFGHSGRTLCSPLNVYLPQLGLLSSRIHHDPSPLRGK